MGAGGVYSTAVTVLGGELAVPCTRTPLERGRTPARGPDGPGPLRVRSVEGRVPRDVNLRTPSGPEGSSGKRALAGAVGLPGRSYRPVERPSRPRSTAGARSPLFLAA